MRKIFLLLLLVNVLGACQKKQYATFDYPTSHFTYHHNEPVPMPRSERTAPIAPVTIPSQQGESTNPPSSADRTTAVSRIESTIEKEKIQTKIPRRTNHKVKISQKKTMNEATKIKNPAATSLILSVVGLVVSLLSVSVTAPIWIFAMGTLMGAAGLVLGISALRRIKNQTLPASSKGMAIAGLILGALTTLAGLAILYTFAVVATYGI